MELQGEVAGLQGQTPAWCDSRAGASALICRAADKEASGGRAPRVLRAGPPAVSGCGTWGRPCTSLGLTSHL